MRGNVIDNGQHGVRVLGLPKIAYRSCTSRSQYFFHKTRKAPRPPVSTAKACRGASSHFQMADEKDSEVDFKNTTKHDEAALSDSSVAPKLDPHGFPLRPQPSDDPLGIQIQSIPALNCFMLTAHRSSQLEPVAEALGPSPSLFPCFSWSILSGSHRARHHLSKLDSF